MTTRTRIAAFVVVLGASFGAGALAGASVDPLRQDEPARPHAPVSTPSAPGAGTTVAAPGEVHDDHGGHAP